MANDVVHGGGAAKGRGLASANTSTSTVDHGGFGGVEESFMEPTFSERMRRYVSGGCSRLVCASNGP